MSLEFYGVVLDDDLFLMCVCSDLAEEDDEQNDAETAMQRLEDVD